MTMIMEGREWHRIAQANGHPLRGVMQRGKVYLYQLYTTIFVEFPYTALNVAHEWTVSDY